MLGKLSKLNVKQASVKTEIIAGITTFLAMAYILEVNPPVLHDAGMGRASVFTATTISTGFASIVMGLVANYPVTLATGTGVNALFVRTTCGQMGMSWQTALAGVFISGLIFIVISVTGIRRAIINTIPKQLKMAIDTGIGFFIAFVRSKNTGIVAGSASTFVTIGNFADPQVLLVPFGILLTIILLVKRVPTAVFIGIVITAVIGIVYGAAFGLKGIPALPDIFFKMNFHLNAIGSFMDGFGELFANPLNAFAVIFSFLFVDFFDTASTLVAVVSRIGLVNRKGKLENVERTLVTDTVGTVTGAVLGASTVTPFAESTPSVEVGGRTGLTACTTSTLFFVSILFSPIVLPAITNAIAVPALVVVGILMAQWLRKVEWDNMVYATARFITVLMMTLTYSIFSGIAFGFIAYTIAMTAAGRTKEVHITVWVLTVIFLIYFALPQLM